MSVSERKIGYYNFVFEKYRSDEHFFDKDLFVNLLNYIYNLPSDNKILKNSNSNKAISIDSYTCDIINFSCACKVIFKSCKYNHSPDYMSSIDGTERESDKQAHEGEKEKTHLCMKVNEVEAEMILEERKTGISVSQICYYLNKYLARYMKSINKARNFKIIYGIIPSEDFLSVLRSMSKVRIGELYTHKINLGSESMNLMEREDASMRDEIIITVKSNKGGSLLKRNIISLYNSLISGDSKVTRIRIYGTNEEGKIIKLDSDNMKKMEYVRALLDEKGIVESSSIFIGMMNILWVGQE
ncbi:MAG: hypothetical protein VR69_00655 [Peptococcaceae bacterium BRH_c4b]|nr:MAG: hypothetical protein VR69_00655 [Peptococcaceae bacterium BRH_c4b]